METQHKYDPFAFFTCDQRGELWNELHQPREEPFLVTASKVPEIVGVGYNTPTAIYKWYKGEKAEKENEAMLYGSRTEEEAKNTFLKLNPEFVGVTPGTKFHDKFPELPYACSPDLIVLRHQQPSPDLINVEIKCPFKQIVPLSELDVKKSYIVQTQVQMEVLNLDLSFLWFFAPRRCSLFTVNRDREAMGIINFLVNRFKKTYLDMNCTPHRGEHKAAAGPFFQLNQILVQSVEFVKSFTLDFDAEKNLIVWKEDQHSKLF